MPTALTEVPDLRASPFGVGVHYRLNPADAELAYALHPDEAATLTPRTVEKRRREFRLGRGAAHHALRAFGLDAPGPVGRAKTRAPLWPEGIVGTITHTHDLAAAAVATAQDYRGLGLDIEERHRSLELAIAKQIANDRELRWIHAEPEDADLRMRLLFSAKESVFKATFPLGEVFLGFEDAELTWEIDRGAFRARLLKSPDPSLPVDAEFEVGARVSAAHVQTWAALPVSG